MPTQLHINTNSVYRFNSVAMDEFLLAELETARLELEFERAIQQAQQIYEEERSRILRVNLLLQQDVSEALEEQLEHVQEIELKQSEEETENLQARLVDLEEQYEISQAELKSCMRNIENYQIEINALQASSADSSKTITEKLALQRELNSIKPELDHLRTLSSTQQNVLADKLSLQRELATAQVELENERRTIQRLKQQSKSGDPALEGELDDVRKELVESQKKLQKLERQNVKRANEKSTADAALVDELEAVKCELVDAKFRTEQAEKNLQQASIQNNAASLSNDVLEDLKKDLSKEKKALQKLEREQLKKTTEWESQKESLESKLDAFRAKLRTTKEQLKEAQDELERREQAKFAESAAATMARITGRATSIEPAQVTSQNPKKRNVARFEPDMTIGTPGNGRPAAKKARQTMSSVGDKSTFSITPFLNKTVSILPESPNAVMNTTINEIAHEADLEAKKKEPAKKGATKKDTTGKSTSTAKGKAVAAQPLKDVASRGNLVVKAPVLAKVIEEDAEPISESGQQLLPQPTETLASETTTLQPKKKKLLGARKNIFDDDEPDGIKKISTGGHVGRLGKTNLGTFGLGKNKPRMLAEFSPLKKDRRTVEGVGS